MPVYNDALQQALLEAARRQNSYLPGYEAPTVTQVPQYNTDQVYKLPPEPNITTATPIVPQVQLPSANQPPQKVDLRAQGFTPRYSEATPLEPGRIIGWEPPKQAPEQPVQLPPDIAPVKPIEQRTELPRPSTFVQPIDLSAQGYIPRYSEATPLAPGRIIGWSLPPQHEEGSPTPRIEPVTPQQPPGFVPVWQAAYDFVPTAVGGQLEQSMPRLPVPQAEYQAPQPILPGGSQTAVLPPEPLTTNRQQFSESYGAIATPYVQELSRLGFTPQETQHFGQSVQASIADLKSGKPYTTDNYEKNMLWSSQQAATQGNTQAAQYIDSKLRAYQFAKASAMLDSGVNPLNVPYASDIAQKVGREVAEYQGGQRREITPDSSAFLAERYGVPDAYANRLQAALQAIRQYSGNMPEAYLERTDPDYARYKNELIAHQYRRQIIGKLLQQGVLDDQGNIRQISPEQSGFSNVVRVGPTAANEVVTPEVINKLAKEAERVAEQVGAYIAANTPPNGAGQNQGGNLITTQSGIGSGSGGGSLIGAQQPGPIVPPVLGGGTSSTPVITNPQQPLVPPTQQPPAPPLVSPPVGQQQTPQLINPSQVQPQPQQGQTQQPQAGAPVNVEEMNPEEQLRVLGELAGVSFRTYYSKFLPLPKEPDNSRFIQETSSYIEPVFNYLLNKYLWQQGLYRNPDEPFYPIAYKLSQPDGKSFTAIAFDPEGDAYYIVEYNRENNNQETIKYSAIPLVKVQEEFDKYSETDPPPAASLLVKSVSPFIRAVLEKMQAKVLPNEFKYSPQLHFLAEQYNKCLESNQGGVDCNEYLLDLIRNDLVSQAGDLTSYFSTYNTRSILKAVAEDVAALRANMLDKQPEGVEQQSTQSTNKKEAKLRSGESRHSESQRSSQQSTTGGVPVTTTYRIPVHSNLAQVARELLEIITNVYNPVRDPKDFLAYLFLTNPEAIKLLYKVPANLTIAGSKPEFNLGLGAVRVGMYREYYPGVTPVDVDQYREEKEQYPGRSSATSEAKSSSSSIGPQQEKKNSRYRLVQRGNRDHPVTSQRVPSAAYLEVLPEHLGMLLDAYLSNEPDGKYNQEIAAILSGTAKGSVREQEFAGRFIHEIFSTITVVDLPPKDKEDIATAAGISVGAQQNLSADQLREILKKSLAASVCTYLNSTNQSEKEEARGRAAAIIRHLTELTRLGTPGIALNRASGLGERGAKKELNDKYYRILVDNKVMGLDTYTRSPDNQNIPPGEFQVLDENLEPRGTKPAYIFAETAIGVKLLDQLKEQLPVLRDWAKRSGGGCR